MFVLYEDDYKKLKASIGTGAASNLVLAKTYAIQVNAPLIAFICERIHVCFCLVQS